MFREKKSEGLEPSCCGLQLFIVAMDPEEASDIAASRRWMASLITQIPMAFGSLGS